jgi:FkbM family methyltransferase
MSETRQQKSLRRKLIGALDRSGGRWLLGVIATVAARLTTRRNIRIFYDDLWVHRLDGEYFGDRPVFDYYIGEFKNWPFLHDLWRNEARECWFHKYTPNSGDVIIDVGAGTGTDLLAFSKAVGATGHVFAIEAHPDTFRSLEKTCRWNGLDNVTCIHRAIADHSGTLYISDLDTNVANYVGTDPSGTHSIAVPASSIDEIIEEYAVGEVALLKMNIEGAERLAFCGMTNSVPKIQNMAIACHDFLAEEQDDDFFRTRSLVVDYLKNNGFSVATRLDDPRPYVKDHVHGSRL